MADDETRASDRADKDTPAHAPDPEHTAKLRMSEVEGQMGRRAAYAYLVWVVVAVVLLAVVFIAFAVLGRSV